MLCLSFCAQMADRKYQAPEIVVVRFVMERGYALSAGIIDPEQIENELLMLGMMETENYHQTEDFNVYWQDRSDNGFFD